MADRFETDSGDNIETAVSKPAISKASPRPKSASRKSKKGAGSKSSPYRSFGSTSASQSSKNARDLWLAAVKGGGTSTGTKKGHIGKRTPTEYWTDTLRRTGYGITPETLGQSAKQSLTGLKKQDMSYKSTSHYLRQVAGTEKLSKTMPAESHSKPSPGRPAYKSQEEYYDEVLALKKQIQQLNSENSTHKLKMRRLEEDNLKKEREIEQLLDPSKSEEMRRTLADRKPDTGAVIHSLKQKILKLEHQLKDREAAYSKLQSDLKTTKVEELKLQMESFYREILRLNQIKSSPALSKSSAASTSSAPVKESPSKMRALQETIMRMNEKNVRLQTENKSLKQDLEKMMEEKATTKDKQKEYEDMSKKELMGAISKLEKRLDRAEGDTLSILSDVDGRKDAAEGKIVLEGSVAQRLDQLDKRETELLEDLSKQKALVKRLKEDRTHYRKKCDEKEREIKSLRKEVEDLQQELDGFYDKDKAPTPRPTPRDRRKSASPAPKRRTSHSSGMSSGSDKERQRRVQNFTENHAAKQIQRGWRSHKGRKEEDERKEKQAREEERRVREFQEAHAAKTIQRHWRGHQEQDQAAELIQSAMRGHRTRQINMSRMRGYMAEDTDVTSTVTESELDDATDFIQSSMRGHLYRKGQVKRHSGSGSYMLTEENGEELDDDTIEFLQATFRGHMARKKHVAHNTYTNRRDSYSPRGRSPRAYSPRSHSPRTASPRHLRHSPRHLDSEGEEMDSDDVHSVPSSRGRTSVSGRSTPKSFTRPMSACVKKSRTPPPALDSDDDDDDDLVVVSDKKKFF